MADPTVAELLSEYDAALTAAKADPKAAALDVAVAEKIALAQQEVAAKEAAVSPVLKEQLRVASANELAKHRELYAVVDEKYAALRAQLYQEIEAIKAEGVAEHSKLTNEELDLAIVAARRTVTKLEAAKSARVQSPAEVKSEQLGKLS